MSGPSSLLPSFLFLFTYDILYSISRKNKHNHMLDGYSDSYYKTFRTGPGYTVLSIAKATSQLQQSCCM